jgi:Sulfotransferase domain
MKKFYSDMETSRGLGFTFRVLSGHFRLNPEFIIIGSGKCGTTFLYEYLMKHPQILHAYTKEVHYFDHNFKESLEWYKAHFPLIKNAKRLEKRLKDRVITGEATPYYMAHPLVPSRIANLFPNIKIIVLLRNPIDRAYSQYNMVKHEYKHETLSFKDAILHEDNRISSEYNQLKKSDNHFSFNHIFYSYIHRGLYALHLENWFNHFKRDQFLFIKSEDLFSSPSEKYDQVLHFLGVQAFTPNVFEKVNSRKYLSMDFDTKEYLSELFRPHNETLRSLIGSEFYWD